MPMVTTDAAFLLIESREHPAHVAGLQLYQPPEDAGPEYVSELYRELLTHTEVAPFMRRRAYRSAAALGQWSWTHDPDLELDYHVRLSALPRPGRVRELLELVSRLHSALLDRHRPLWEYHLVEGLADGRFATYTKVHHALMDGVSVVRMLSGGLSTDPEARGDAPFWAPRPRARSRRSPRGPLGAVDSAARVAAELAGLPPAVTRLAWTVLRDHAATLPFQAPTTMLNVPIGGARRFAGQSWPLQRVRAVGAAADATVNDVAVAMCSGALRRYLAERDALPDQPLVAMLPVSLRGRVQGSGDGGNAIGAILCDLATEQADPAVRLARIRAATRNAKTMMAGLSPAQIMAVSAAVVAGLALAPIPGLRRMPPFNLVISNVPGNPEVRYWNGARLTENYPLSMLVEGQALNITLTSYADRVEFGVLGCRRSVPHLQRLLGHLDDELTALEAALR